MFLSKHKLIATGLWFTLLLIVLPLSLMAINPVADVSLFNYVMAQDCDTDFTVTINFNGFQPNTVTTTVILSDTMVGGGFINQCISPVTVTFPQGMFGPTVVLIDNGESKRVCEPNPQGGSNHITVTLPGGGDFGLTVNVIPETIPKAITEAVGGVLLSNPFIMMLPAFSLVFLMVIILFAGKKVSRIPGI
jgi:hypothetical protein